MRSVNGWRLSAKQGGQYRKGVAIVGEHDQAHTPGIRHSQGLMRCTLSRPPNGPEEANDSHGEGNDPQIADISGREQVCRVRGPKAQREDDEECAEKPQVHLAVTHRGLTPEPD